jgi:hypothetical protein
VEPIDLTAAGWAALEQADPKGAARIDRHNCWYDEECGSGCEPGE